ncbi:hypothetical protein L1987_06129 [Smallanthus sonchifolius]|uniref:Uncharacterized protein n=1 Tax=Smallanthus sonchifolius TaxID=185202 RepID=A0ACB9JXD0_9ASTR|nr:hypothetical protein L1987_06129 [Smallanthus sonchifolius]
MKQPMMPNPMMSSSFPPTNITTDQIQKFLDENKQLILAIMTNQNLGKLAECAQYQALLQKNLMYLAAIADAQPPTPTPAPPTISSQMGPLAHAGIPQQGGFFMQQQQHPQAAVMAQQSSSFPQQMPAMQFPQVIQPQMGVRSGGPSSAASDIWRGSMQDGGAAEGSSAGKDGHGAAAGGSDEAK